MKFKSLTATIAALAIAAPLTLVSAAPAVTPAPNSPDLHNGRRAYSPNEVVEMQNGQRVGEINGAIEMRDGQRTVDGRNVGRNVNGRMDRRNVDGRIDGVNNRTYNRTYNLNRRNDGVNHRVDGVNRVNDGVNRRIDGINHRNNGVNHVNDGMNRRVDGVNHRNHDGLARRHRPFIRGYEDGNFRPDQPLTRAEFSKMLHSLYGDRNHSRTTDGSRNMDRARNTDGARNLDNHNLGRNERTNHSRNGTHGRMTFGNLPHNHWARNEIQHIHEMGYFSRIDGDRFRADEPVTRSEFFEVLSHIQGRAITSDHHAHNNTAHGNGTITRSEAVAVLHNLEGRPQEWTGNMRFNDVHEGHPHHAHIMHAVNGHS